MPVDRTLFATFRSDRSHCFGCPKCGKATYRLVDEGEDIKIRFENRTTLRGHGLGDFPDYDDTSFLFHGWIQCADGWCRHNGTIFGKADTELYFDQKREQDDVHMILKVEGFSDPPALIAIHLSVLEPIRAEVRKAEHLIWSDPSSAAGRLRTALERLMDHAGIAKTTIQRGKRRPLDLNTRIQRFLPNDQSFQDLAHALRWLGNAGTHGNVGLEDALVAFDLVEYALDQRFDPHPKLLLRKAAKIRKNKGPLSS